MTARQIISRYYVIAGLHTLAASLIWGVNTIFLLGAGLNIAEVFIANAAFTVGMVVFEIPTGVLADTSGRRLSFLLSVIVLFISTLAYVALASMQAGLFWWCLVSVFLGLGYTFYSGAVDAWLVDALKTTDFAGELNSVFARAAIVTGAAMLIGSVSGGVIGTLDLALPYVVRALLLAILFVIACFSMHDLGYQRRALSLAALPVEMRKVTRASLRYGWQQPNIRLLMLVAFFQSGFMFWAFYAWQPYVLELYGDPDAIWILGIISALTSLATIAGNSITEWKSHRQGQRTTIMLVAVAVFVLAMIGVGVIHAFWLTVPLYLIAMLATGVLGPVRQAYMHKLIPSEQRATVISFDSMISNAGGILSQTTLGPIAQQVGIAQGYILGGAATLLALPLLLILRRMGGPADLIVGDAGKQSPCAGQGIPDVAQVDTAPYPELPAEPAAD